MKQSGKERKSGEAGEAKGKVGEELPAPAVSQLHVRAESRLRRQAKFPKAAPVMEAGTDPDRILHELQVHQVELEMQNVELLETRNRLENLLENYTDLYDFAPVGYFTLTATGVIQQVNLTGASLVGVERSRLAGRSFTQLLPASLRAGFRIFLKQIFAGATVHSAEFDLVRKGQLHRAVSLEAQCSTSKGECRVAVMDITDRRLAEAVQERLTILTASNVKLEGEIERRRAIEVSLKQSRREQRELLAKSKVMQEELRYLSRQVLRGQEEERKRISRELHDVIAQTLTGINVRLDGLKKEVGINPRSFERNLMLTQRLVEQSVEVVHRFARELRPAVLDDLGLIPALHSYLEQFTAQTGIHTELKSVAAVEQLDNARRTVLYRVAQAALSNVAQHAKASRVTVVIESVADGVRMEVRDDGISFQVGRVLNSKGNKRLGLLGMRERMDMVGGKFMVESGTGVGTTVIAQVPFGKPVRGKPMEQPGFNRPKDL
jgi:PAS domain S-box-containing protein